MRVSTGMPPLGVVTFLFTDVEGSTRRWEADAEGMRAALAAHDALLGDAIGAHGGFMFKHTGDGMCAAFASPRSAVDAAVAAQRALELPVRMARSTAGSSLITATRSKTQKLAGRYRRVTAIAPVIAADHYGDHFPRTPVVARKRPRQQLRLSASGAEEWIYAQFNSYAQSQRRDPTRHHPVQMEARRFVPTDVTTLTTRPRP